MSRLEIAVAVLPAFVHKYDYSNREENMKGLAEYAFAAADALLAKAAADEKKDEEQRIALAAAQAAKSGGAA